MDSNGSGLLERFELSQGLRNLGIDADDGPGGDVEKIMGFFDRDGAGRIDIREFHRGLRVRSWCSLSAGGEGAWSGGGRVCCVGGCRCVWYSSTGGSAERSRETVLHVCLSSIKSIEITFCDAAGEPPACWKIPRSDFVRDGLLEEARVECGARGDGTRCAYTNILGTKWNRIIGISRENCDANEVVDC